MGRRKEVGRFVRKEEKKQTNQEGNSSSLGRRTVLVVHSFPTLCNPMDCSWPGSSIHGILQARILEWVALPFSSTVGL